MEITKAREVLQNYVREGKIKPYAKKELRESINLSISYFELLEAKMKRK